MARFGLILAEGQLLHILPAPHFRVCNRTAQTIISTSIDRLGMRVDIPFRITLVTLPFLPEVPLAGPYV